VTREVDGGLETVKCKLPAVITTDLRLNQPRYCTLQNIMKAKSKPVSQETPSSLGVEIKEKYKVIKTEEPPKRKGGIKVSSVEELMEKLTKEAKVL
jgi:electron transfer flavoprotein beta subunit